MKTVTLNLPEEAHAALASAAAVQGTSLDRYLYDLAMYAAATCLVAERTHLPAAIRQLGFVCDDQEMERVLDAYDVGIQYLGEILYTKGITPPDPP